MSNIKLYNNLLILNVGRASIYSAMAPSSVFMMNSGARGRGAEEEEVRKSS